MPRHPSTIPSRLRPAAPAALVSAVFCIALAMAALLPRAAAAAPQAGSPGTDPIKVGVVKAAAFLEASKSAPGQYTGFSGDLWNAVAGKLGARSEFTEFPDFPSLIAAAKDKRIDVAVTNMLMTEERAEQLDFSYPITDGGLRVLVRSEPHHTVSELWDALAERGHFHVLGVGALIVVGMSIVLIGVWRRFDKDFPSKYHDAFAESLYRTVSLTVSGKTKVTDNPTHAYSRIGAAIWLAFGAGVVAYITATFSSAMTMQASKRLVNAASDLSGKAVGAMKGTVGERYCQTHALDVRSFENADDLMRALLSGTVVAAVGEGTMLEAYDRAHPELPVTVVGAIFEKHKFAFAMPVGSPLRRPIDLALLSLEESGETAAIYARYFSGS